MVDKTVYFMRAESGLVKIGVSTNVPVRQKAISGSIGGPVTLVREVSGDAKVERAYHRKFADRRVYGEWFEFDADMLTAEVEVPSSPFVKLRLDISPSVRGALSAVAAEDGLSMNMLFRISFALFKVCREAKRKGQHVGVVNDVTKLDREIIGIL